MKKKILILGMTSIVGGIETFLMNLIKYIDKDKFQIDFLVKEEIKGNYKTIIDKNGCNIFVIGMLKKNPIMWFKNIINFYKNNKYDIIHINACNSGMILYVLPAIFNKHIRIISHSHSNCDANKLQNYIFRPLMNLISTDYWACSKLAGEWLFGKGKSDSLIIIKNAIESPKFIYNEEIRNKIRKELNIENKFIVGHVGRFMEPKNHNFLIDIFNILNTQIKNSVLLLVGTGPLENEIKEKVEKLGLSDKVIFLGVCNNTNDIYQTMDIFVFPSLFEGLGIVLIEAQASGLRCITSKHVVPFDVNIANLVEFYDLDDSIETWTNAILKYENGYERRDMSNIVFNSGYDVKSMISIVEKYYS